MPALISIRNLAHSYGERTEAAPTLRRQVLADIDVEIAAGEVVLLTGPSGSGKTTLLTLIGALRSVQQGNLETLGVELAGASAAQQVAVRRQIGYIFQAHNLLPALTARENVLLGLELEPGLDAVARQERADAMLAAVGLAEHRDKRPDALSGGQRQRVAVARALARRPRLVLADEPTASLDSSTGRAIAELLDRMARDQGVTVLLVTHDHRVFDIADRVLHLEDGRLSSFTAAVAANTERLMASLARNYRSGELLGRLAALPEDRFATFLAELTTEARQFLDAIELAESRTVESMLRQVLDGLTRRIGELLGAERATLFLLDRRRGELWSLYAGHADGAPVRLRIPVGRGIAGAVAESGVAKNVPDAYADPQFDRAVDRTTGFRTRNLLCAPIEDARGGVIAVAQLLNKQGEAPFSIDDERRFRELARGIGPVLESWLEIDERWRERGATGDARTGGAAAGVAG